MKLDYNRKPFSQLPNKLRAWFEEMLQQLESDAAFPFWRVVLPKGSTMDDATLVSRCLLELFPERARRERCTPVVAEFTF